MPDPLLHMFDDHDPPQCWKIRRIDELESQLTAARARIALLEKVATDVTNCYECFVYTVNGGYPIPEDGQPEPKREEDYDEYDYMMAPLWKALVALLPQAALATPTEKGE